MQDMICEVAGCTRLGEASRHGRLRLCSAHRKRKQKFGSTLATQPIRAHFRTNPDEEISYKSAHGRVRHVKGSARDHACIDCGGIARDWSYDGQDPNALTSPEGMRYSLDPRHYVPRCRGCHVQYDHPKAVS